MGQFPRSPFAVPTSSFNAPVKPPATDPDSGPQATIRVSCEWLPYIRGALTQLMLQTTWLGTVAEVDLAQDRANALIERFLANAPGDCGAPLPAPEGCDCEDDMAGCSVTCDCNGKVTITCPNGQTYQLVTTNMQAGQPGAGAEQPPANGGHAHWCFTLSGPGTSFLPTNVNSGDVLTVDMLEGAWSDTPIAHWWCPNGWTFFLGQCTGPYPAVAGDPLMSANHMELIAHIGGSYYRILNPDSNGNPQPFTVPPGITNQPLTLLANTSAPSAISGSISFCIEMQNNAAGTWTHTFDFTLSPFMFVPRSGPGDTDAQWTAGIGWQATTGNASCPPCYFDDFHRTLTPTQIDSVEVVYDPTVAAGAGVREVRVDVGAGDVTYGALSTGTGPTDTLITNTQAGVINLRIIMDTDGAAGAETGQVSRVVVKGHGVDPF